MEQVGDEVAQENNKCWITLAVVCLTMFLLNIENTILYLALPSISGSLNANASQLQWVINIYSLVLCAMMITTGSIIDRFGRKRLLIYGLVLFGLGSLGAGFALNIQMLIICRAIRGLAAALMMPATLSIIVDVFEEGKERAKAISIWATMFTLGAAVGPFIGALLLEAYGWSSVFFLNIPFVLICLIGTILFTPESFSFNAPKPDFIGVLLSVIGLIVWVYALIHAGEVGWSSLEVWIPFAVGVIFLVAFCVWQKRSTNPMFPLEFFKNKSFSGANTALGISAFAMTGTLFFFSQFFQSIQGYQPLMAVFCMLPQTPVICFSTMYSPKIMRKIGYKKTLSIGLAICGLGSLLFGKVLGINAPYWQLCMGLLGIGIGTGLIISPATTAVMNSLPPERAGVGSGMNNTIRQMGTTLGVAVLGSVMNGQYRAGVESLSGVNGITPDMMKDILSSVQNAHIAAGTVGGELQYLIVQTSSQAFVNGVRGALYWAAIVLFLCILIVWLTLYDMTNKKLMSDKRG